MIIDKISRQNKILILGFAREGQSTYKFLRSKFPDLIIGLADQKTPDWIPSDPKIETFFGPDYLNNLVIGAWLLVIKSPGISPHLPQITEAKKQGVIFTSHMQIFLEVCPSNNTIGVTGTKGKSTTTSLIYHVLQTTSQPAVLVGNIGKPALDYLPEITPETWVVMELSSYQLMDMTISPHIAVLLAIYPDHLDYHTDFEEYKDAKLNITKYQTEKDYLITQTDIPTQAKKIIFSLKDFDTNIKTKLLGNHNKLNIIPSLVISKLLKLPKKLTYQAIANFSPLETRLELVAKKNGIKFYADTLATIPQATIAAISVFSSDLETLICGGHDRKQNYSELAQKILDSHIKNVILFPSTGARIEQEIKKLQKSTPSLIKEGAGGVLNVFHTDSMFQAVNFALEHTSSGKICLLSPAAPSFTLFKDYRDEYDQYKQAINSASY